MPPVKNWGLAIDGCRLDAAGEASRREFLKLMGASLALAGLTGCRWPKEAIVPATRQPGDRVPGVPVQYATAIELGGVATGLLVTSYDGRPIKIEGNDRHPFSRGKSNAWMQASLLELYDPDRSQWPVRRAGGQRQNATWEEFGAFARAHFSDLRGKGGAGLAVLSEASSSPSLADMRGRFMAAYPQGQWYEYEPLSRDNEREGARRAFGRPHRTHLHLDQADVIVSFDSDFLMTHPAALKHAGDFAARRRGDGGTMNRLYVLESNLTITGGMADHRWAVRSSEIGVLLAQLAARLQGATTELQAAIGAIAQDLEAHRGRCVVIVGPQQPPAVHAIAHQVNELLGATGQAITFTEEPDPDRPPHIEAIAKLVDDMRSGAVHTLVLLGGNPVYDAPADVRFAEALRRIPTTIHLGLYDEEASQGCMWHVPRAHYLEAWGDARAWDGTISIVQPLIEPLYGGRTPIELLALLTGERVTGGYDIVRRTFGSDAGRWEHSLHDGVVADTAWAQRAAPNAGTPGGTPQGVPSGVELVFAPDYRVYDGRFANNAWLQELPDPITKLTWDNAALIAPADAQRFGVKSYGDELRIETAAGALEIPAYIVPGHAEGSITLPLGSGRGPAAGKAGDGAGRDVYPLRTSAAWYVTTAKNVAATGRRCELATTQDHHAIDSEIGREEAQRRIETLVRDKGKQVSSSQQEEAPDRFSSLWKEKEYRGHKWGMAIDLSACNACGACIIACQAENNIPVVGKAEVARGREMHWIRVDRYFREGIKGADADLDPLIPRSLDPCILHQPVSCVHCETAPCEQVCPVAATVHDEEGLNVQVYNRCVGTRYCANNCPLKVRRFNWFYNHHGPYHPRSRKGDVTPLPGWLKRQDLTDIEKLVNNPKVTMRSRGVMEKCTFCTQRINAVKIKARNERWPSIPDGLIAPACVQACPTDALVFGDLNDPTSRVRRLHADPRAYELLTELNLRARTKYLARMRNPAERT